MIVCAIQYVEDIMTVFAEAWRWRREDEQALADAMCNRRGASEPTRHDNLVRS